MKYKKEQLIKLLKLIEEISCQPGNEWFRNQLLSSFGRNVAIPSLSDQASLEAKINLIQKYLSIDISNLIDYSAFDEPSREQLFRDNLEMMRFQKGTPNHKIDFGEFCRYAHLQAEEMINYFLNKLSDSKLEKVELFIQQYLSSYDPKKRPTEIHHIYYTNKLMAFNSAERLSKKTVDTLWFINDFRNELSHRNSFSMQKEDKDLMRYEKEGFLQYNYNIDFKKLGDRQRGIYNKGKYVITKRKEDFDSIISAIEEFKTKILLAIQNPPTLKNNKITIGFANPVLQDLKKKLDGQNK